VQENLAAMVMKLYGTQTPNAERAIMPLFFADVDPEKEMEMVLVSLMGKRQQTPAYKAKNPFGAVPYLEDGELGIFESRAIAKYIVDKYNLTFLVGTTVEERATINQWVESESQNFSAGVAPLLFELFYSRIENRPVNEKVKATTMEKLGKVLDVYEAQLSKHKYLAGDSYTLADVFHTPFLLKVKTLDVFAGVFDNRPYVKAWADDLTSNPAFLKARKLDWDNATPF